MTSGVDPLDELCGVVVLDAELEEVGLRGDHERLEVVLLRQRRLHQRHRGEEQHHGTLRRAKSEDSQSFYSTSSYSSSTSPSSLVGRPTTSRNPSNSIKLSA